MSIRIRYTILLSGWLAASGLQAQLSPGKLTTAHADLEGMFKCTQCHVLGNKLDDNKCLGCHEEIQSLIDLDRGYHSSEEVRTKECAACHSEHHGRNFDMMRFDQENFDHNLTTYELTGAHRRIDCRDCHTPDYIADKDLKQRDGTFLGLQHDCISCHEDVHQNTLSTNDCASCHSTDEFAPAEFFDHDDTDYPLVGKHVEVDCIQCHPKVMRAGKEFQRFAGIEFTNCINCHDDVHDNALGTDCRQCHSEESFNSLARIGRFDHSRTNFPLKGAHARVGCADCHNLKVGLTALFQDQLGIETNNCIACHKDVHDNKFGSNCAECHNEKSFFNVDTEGFDHNLTDFVLKGQHQTVDCRECHTDNLTDPLAHNTCAACHTDYHEGEFTTNGTGPDCAACHTEKSFRESLYTIEQHNQSKFALDGAHLATPCFACHLKEEKWTFRNIGERCVDCHEDVHAGYISAEFYPNQDCQQCHVTDDWVENRFDHNQTAFALAGRHAAITCMECHGVDEATGEHQYAGFVDTPAECAACHEDVHNNQFVENGTTDCSRCHGFADWTVADFDHDNTDFKLEGAHASVDCKECHLPYPADDGRTIIQYKFNSFECVDCHR